MGRHFLPKTPISLSSNGMASGRQMTIRAALTATLIGGSEIKRRRGVGLMLDRQAASTYQLIEMAKPF